MKCSVLLIIFVVSITSAEAMDQDVGFAKIMLTIKAEAWVDGDYIRLADIVDHLPGMNTGHNQFIHHLVLRKTPKIGHSYTLKKTEIVRRLKQQNVFHKIEFVGGDGVVVRRIGRTLSKADIIKQAELLLRNRLAGQFDRYKITLQGTYRDISIPHGQVTYRPRVNKLQTAKPVIWVDILVNQEFFTTIPIWFSAKLYKNVYVAQQSMIRFTEVKREELNIVQREVSRLSVSTVEIESLIKLRVRKSIKKGDIITTGNTEPAPIVSRQQYINMVIRLAGIGITKRVVSQKDANIGDIITVRGDKSTEIYDVVIKSKNEGVPIWCETKPTAHCL